jgi:hypothetical protein
MLRAGGIAHMSGGFGFFAGRESFAAEVRVKPDSWLL